MNATQLKQIDFCCLRLLQLGNLAQRRLHLSSSKAFFPDLSPLNRQESLKSVKIQRKIRTLKFLSHNLRMLWLWRPILVGNAVAVMTIHRPSGLDCRKMYEILDGIRQEMTKRNVRNGEAFVRNEIITPYLIILSFVRQMCSSPSLIYIWIGRG